MKNTIISATYFMISIVFISYGSVVSPLAALILKALIIPVLMLLVILNLRTSGERQTQMIILALIFSWFGDILLGVPASIANLFIPGLISFLLAHVMYLIVFFRTHGENIIIRKKIYFLIPVLFYGVLLLAILFSSLGEMKLPVTVYTLAILTMVCSAITRYGKVNRVSWILVMAGAILFLMSDSGIAINKFLKPFPGAQLMIMSTYVLAQFMIVIGYIRQYSVQKKLTPE
jgi:uncharacterized membrane protein YhhN